MYQFVRTSRNDLSDWHAPNRSYESSAEVVVSTVDRNFARTYLSRTFTESVRWRPVTPAAFAYSERKYHEFHSGNRT